MKGYIKTVIALAVMTVCCMPAATAQMRWSATAGVNLNNMKFKQDLVPVSQSVGFQAGVVGEVIFPGIGFGLDLGLLYNQQGAKIDVGSKEIWSSLGYGNETATIHSINVPIHLRFKYSRLNGLEDKIMPFVYGGPEFNLQVAHNNGDLFKYSGGDLGLTCGGGVELMRRWQISASYTWGMTYALKTQLLDDFSARSRYWTVRVSYFW